LAHTTWFFETFLLQPWLPGYEVFHSKFSYLFNSYYEAVGLRHPRPQRGLISRPTVKEVYAYRAYVDQAMTVLIEAQGDRPEVESLLSLGLHHEQQHQELLLMDIKYNFSINPLYPAYQIAKKAIASVASVPNFPTEQNPLAFSNGIHEIGHHSQGFCFDNELPRHAVLLRDGVLDSRLMTNGDYLEFMTAGGYQKPEYWLAEGWGLIQSEQWTAPLYWIEESGQWFVMTLMGLQPLVLEEPVCHVSYYEADAFARWKGKSLPTESEWEVVAQTQSTEGQFADSGYFHPLSSPHHTQLFGTVWEWTQSPYVNYPGFQAAKGAVGEYNGKFMSNQMVLRGGACVTPAGHIRASYRNFFPPHARWQFAGIRLCSHE
jgi:ergothioneine biosynthesis protein EgtB